MKDETDKLEEFKKEKYYFQDWIEEPSKEEIDRMDEDGKDFYNDFIPVYKKYAGTKSLLKYVKLYIGEHIIKRKDDFRFQMIQMWIDHIRLYREFHGIEFVASDIFKVRIPKEILSVI